MTCLVSENLVGTIGEDEVVQSLGKGPPAMLVLSRRVNEQIVLPQLGITISVVSVRGGAVKLAIDAPREIRILRKEVLSRMADFDPIKPESPVAVGR